jgi:hypothetical protein
LNWHSVINLNRQNVLRYRAAHPKLPLKKLAQGLGA